ncbi:MAG: hypothetical protein HZB26_15120 [Candidatus Hydrogenedentes bacterium]|nr:hypothetical protein [Candidatus Hydrogenedentota bacterium]
MNAEKRNSIHGVHTRLALYGVLVALVLAYPAAAAAPAIVLVVPDYVTHAGPIEIKVFGSGLYHAQEVRFNGVSSPSITPVSDVLVEALFPEELGDGTYDISVVTDTATAELSDALEINSGGGAAACGGTGGSGGSNGGGPTPPTLVAAVWDGLSSNYAAIDGSSVQLNPGNLTGSMLAPGVFTFTVPRDSYTAVASAPGFDDCHVQADLSSGGTFTAEFAMGTCVKNTPAKRVVGQGGDSPVTISQRLSRRLWDCLLLVSPVGVFTAPSIRRFIQRSKRSAAD